MKFGLLTTHATNPGDDLIRAGVVSLLRAAYPGETHTFVELNKHRPMQVYPPWHPCRWADAPPRGRATLARVASTLFHRLGHSRFDNCDAIVACGTPMLWEGCRFCEWAVPFWEHLVARLCTRMPVLNLGAGSCYAWRRQPETIVDAGDRRYLERIFEHCRLNTVRDELAARLVAPFAGAVPVVACPAFLAAPPRVRTEGGERILFSYMPAGGHYDFDQGVDGDRWAGTARELVRRLQARRPVAFLCHSDAEARACRELMPGVPCVQPRTPAEYAEAAAGTAAAVCNRMHAAVALAGYGVPAVAVGTDTRMLMAAEIGLATIYVDDARADMLEDAAEELAARRQTERERLATLVVGTRARYEELVAGQRES